MREFGGGKINQLGRGWLGFRWRETIDSTTNNPLKPSLKQMSDPMVTPVKRLSINSVELAHSSGEIPIRSLDHQMVVIVHQAVGLAEPVKSIRDVGRILRNSYRSVLSLKIGLRSLPREVT
jgi:hypothetical protein